MKNSQRENEEMAEIKERRLETSVLVIGAGGSGLRAAIEAHSIDAEVIIVSKGGFPSGCTSVAMGEMLAAFDKQVKISLIL